MTNPTDVLIERRDNGVLTITWNVPDRLNGFDPVMLNTAAEAVENVGEDIRAVMLTGTGRAFSSGAALSGDITGGDTLGAANRLVRAMIAAPVPVIVGVNGVAAGVGTSIALAADVTVAKSSGYFLLAFVNIGLMPDGGSSELVAASMGRARANAMAMLGEKLPADDAAAAGLIAFSVPDEEFDERLAELVDRLAAGPTAALAAMKRVMNAATLPTINATLDAEYAGQQKLFETADFSEGVTAFVEKRPATFQGR